MESCIWARGKAQPLEWVLVDAVGVTKRVLCVN
jgi:hypothetical protein